MTKQYILADITKKIGSKNHSWIYDVTFVDSEDLTIYMSVVDSSYRNFTKWEHLVTGAVPYGLYTGLRRTSKQDRDGNQVINADFAPQLVMPMTEREVEQYIEILQEQLR